jgi:hypothetical protein
MAPNILFILMDNIGYRSGLLGSGVAGPRW